MHVRFPFEEPLTLQTGERVSSAEVAAALSQFVAPQRLVRIEQVRKGKRQGSKTNSPTKPPCARRKSGDMIWMQVLIPGT